MCISKVVSLFCLLSINLALICKPNINLSSCQKGNIFLVNKMSKEDTTILVLKGEDGKILKYDGTGNCALFHEQFDDIMITKGYAGIVSTSNYEVPIPPEEALNNIANGVGDHHDFASSGKF